ncbi:hypothetical protein HMI56_000816 [Coelomomyces lativittatus]|nr:hypothetical protein HMI56_000816 [Coelomomyces lativittatus]
MNETQRLQMEHEKVVEAYSRISGTLPLICPSRNLIRSGELFYAFLIFKTDDMYQISMNKYRTLFLFNDMLSICKKKRKDQYSLRSTLALEGRNTVASIETGFLRIVHDSRILYFSGPPRLLLAWVDNINNKHLY